MKVSSERQFRCVNCFASFYGALTTDGHSICNACKSKGAPVANTFKVGDRVRCSEKDAGRRLANAISLGQSYEVVGVESMFISIVNDLGSERQVFASRFVLADAPSATPAPEATTFSGTVTNVPVGFVSTLNISGGITGITVGPATFVKHDSAKARVDLIPPAVLVEVGHVLRLGAEKYDADNWARGAEWRRYIGAALRHVYAFASGEDKDPESGYSHLAHAICCLLFLFEYARCGLGTDDRHKMVSKP